MADVIVLNGDGEEEHFTDVEAVELASEEGGQTEVFKKLPEVTTEDNGKVLGVVEGAWAKMNAPETYTHPDTHPVSMITGLSDISKTGKYEDLRDKPFGTIFVVPAGEYTFEEVDGASGCYGGYLPIRDEIAVGETYIVSWDGAEYTCVAKNIASISAGLSSSQDTYLGNSTKLFIQGLGDDTGEPFIIYSDTANGTIVAMTDDASEAHTISVRPNDNIRKIDTQYLPDGLATEEYVKKAIENIEVSGGGSVGTETETDILPKQTIVFTADSGGELALEPAISFAVGHTYIVEFDNVEYTCEAALVSDSTTSATVVGNKGLVGGEATSEPFIILTGVLDGELRTGIQLAEVTGTEESHTIRIYQISEGASISWENITDKPFGTETEEVELIPETTYEFVYTSDMGGYFVMTEVSEEVSSAWGSDWDEATVIWDGVSYTVKPQTIGGASFVGNCADIGGSGNGEPFILAIANGQLRMQCIADGIPEDTANAPTINHTVSISVAEDIIKKLDRKYLPGPPEFDLTAMGLPALAMDGTTVTVECDTSELRTALDNGVVKVAFTVYTGSAEATCIGILNAFSMGGEYGAGFIGAFAGMPMMLAFNITTTILTGRIITLVTTTT